MQDFMRRQSHIVSRTLGLDASQAERLSAWMTGKETQTTVDDFFRVQAWKRLVKSQSLSTHKGSLKCAALEVLLRKSLKEKEDARGRAVYDGLVNLMSRADGLKFSDLEGFCWEVGYTADLACEDHTFEHVSGFHPDIEKLVHQVSQQSFLGKVIAGRLKAVTSSVESERPAFAIDRLEEMLATLHENDLSQISGLEVFQDFDFALDRRSGFVRDTSLRSRVDQSMKEIADADERRLDELRTSFSRHLQRAVTQYVSGDVLTLEDYIYFLWPENDPRYSPEGSLKELIEVARQKLSSKKIQLKSPADFKETQVLYPGLKDRCPHGFYVANLDTIFLCDMPEVETFGENLDEHQVGQEILYRVRALVEELSHARDFSKQKYDLRYRRHHLVTEGMAKATVGVWTYFFEGDFEFKIARMLGQSMGEYWVPNG